MLCTICFDIEDLCFTESDDATLWFAQHMRERSLPATFFITWDKLQVLQRRGRRDVIDALGRHEIAFHSARHSHHPTIFEFAAARSHQQAVEAIAQREFSALEQMEQAFGRTIRLFGQTGGSFAPAMAEALSSRRMGYAYIPDLMGPKTYAFWWKDCLAFPRVAMLPYFDDCLDDETEIDRRLGDLDRALSEAQSAGAEVVYFFAAHPVRTICAGFPDEPMYGHGINCAASSALPRLYAPAEVQRIRSNFDRVVQRLRQLDQLEFVTFGDLMARVRPAGETVTRAQVRAWCNRSIVSRGYPVTSDDLTPGEGVCALAEFMLANNEQDAVRRISPYGPLAMPRETAPAYTVCRDDLNAVLRSFLRDVEQTRRLPPEVVVGSARMGIGPFSRALVELFVNPAKKSASVYCYSSFLRESIYGAGEACKQIYGWPVHDLRNDVTATLQQTLVASWCMRPARFSRSNEK